MTLVMLMTFINDYIYHIYLIYLLVHSCRAPNCAVRIVLLMRRTVLFGIVVVVVVVVVYSLEFIVFETS